MGQASNLRVEPQPSRTLFLRELQLTLLKRSNILHADSLAELCKDIALCFIDRRTQCINLVAQGVVRFFRLGEFDPSVSDDVVKKAVHGTYLPKLRLKLS